MIGNPVSLPILVPGRAAAAVPPPEPQAPLPASTEAAAPPVTAVDLVPATRTLLLVDEASRHVVVRELDATNSEVVFQSPPEALLRFFAAVRSHREAIAAAER